MPPTPMHMPMPPSRPGSGASLKVADVVAAVQDPHTPREEKAQTLRKLDGLEGRNAPPHRAHSGSRRTDDRDERAKSEGEGAGAKLRKKHPLARTATYHPRREHTDEPEGARLKRHTSETRRRASDEGARLSSALEDPSGAQARATAHAKHVNFMDEQKRDARAAADRKESSSQNPKP